MPCDINCSSASGLITLLYNTLYLLANAFAMSLLSVNQTKVDDCVGDKEITDMWQKPLFFFTD